MPELPEVETVRQTLKRQIINKTINKINIYYDKMLENTTKEEFSLVLVGQTFKDILRYGKYLFFVLDDYIIISHLRMEGKFFLKGLNEAKSIHEHIEFILDDEISFRYHDTRKFGKMALIKSNDFSIAKNYPAIKKLGKEAHAFTMPLVTKKDGTKFGKTEKGNVWLDAEKTSPYAFYQFWLNVSDDDAKKFIRIFTFLTKDEIEALEKQHDEAPNLRILQKALAKDITIRVHGEEEYNKAVEASEILFGKGTTDTLKRLDSATFLSVFEGVPTFEVSKAEILQGINIIDLLAEKTQILASKGEVRRALKENSLSINKEKVKEDFVTSSNDLLNEKYILVQKGKKNYFIIAAK